MKKTLLSAFAIGALMLGACSSEEPVGQPGQDGNVRISLRLPSNLTRAMATWGNGETATQLSYAVYETGSKTPLFYYSADPRGLRHGSQSGRCGDSLRLRRTADHTRAQPRKGQDVRLHLLG